jgi:hypothetical protein
VTVFWAVLFSAAFDIPESEMRESHVTIVGRKVVPDVSRSSFQNLISK